MTKYVITRWLDIDHPGHPMVKMEMFTGDGKFSAGYKPEENAPKENMLRELHCLESLLRYKNRLENQPTL